MSTAHLYKRQGLIGSDPANLLQWYEAAPGQCGVFEVEECWPNPGIRYAVIQRRADTSATTLLISPHYDTAAAFALATNNKQKDT